MKKEGDFLIACEEAERRGSWWNIRLKLAGKVYDFRLPRASDVLSFVIASRLKVEQIILS
jgi:hypothetical protein